MVYLHPVLVRVSISVNVCVCFWFFFFGCERPRFSSLTVMGSLLRARAAYSVGTTNYSLFLSCSPNNVAYYVEQPPQDSTDKHNHELNTSFFLLPSFIASLCLDTNEANTSTSDRRRYDCTWQIFLKFCLPAAAGRWETIF